ncbi:MAG: DNA gyrase subunit A [Candidatus Fermentibacteraceae bacterium]
MNEDRDRRISIVELEDEMKRSYMDYSMSVIVSRALPDVRDGLKPVHRRILYSMYEQGLGYNRPYKKSASVVGDVLGKYHPHGDSAVYDAMVRMAQDFSLLHPLVDGQGNFGSLDGDPAAAYRYTEARMSRIGGEMLADIDRETVDFVPNFDDRLTEPRVLPSAIPNLLVNGSSGIAVGMATNIPPHNLREIVAACCAIIDDPDLPDQRLLDIVHGPDFPIGGVIMGRQGVRDAYLTGKGRIVVRARTSREETNRGKSAIVVEDLPYQVNKSKLISGIADLVKQKRIRGITDIRDESDREGMRIVIELRRDVVPEVVLNQLYKHTAMESSFGANMLALVGNQPRRLTLRQMLDLFLEHRHEVVLRRTRYDLEKAQARAHILEGLLAALDVIDDVIAAIRSSRDREEANAALMEDFDFSEAQAKAILEMRLHRLTSLEAEELSGELSELKVQISELERLVASRDARMELVARELREVADTYGRERRTGIDLHPPGSLTVEDLIPDDRMVIMVSYSGYIKRLALDTYRSQHRGGRGISGASTRDEDQLDQIFVSSNHSYILFFTNLGRCHWLKVYRIPEAGRSSRGKAVVNLIELQPDERPVAHVCVKDFDHRYVLMASDRGRIKKTPLSAYSHPRRDGIWAIRLEGEAELVGARLTDGASEVMLAKRSGLANRFSELEVRPQGRHTMGVAGIRTPDDDRVVSMVVLDESSTILTISKGGYGKRTAVGEYRSTHRGGKGIINMRCTKRTGPVIKVMAVRDTDDIILVSATGMVIRVPAEQIRIIGRSTQGVRLMNLPEGDCVVDAARIPEEEDRENGLDD